MLKNKCFKTCNICGIAKDIKEFYNTDTRCIPCKKEYQKERNKIRKEQKLKNKQKEEIHDKVLKNLCEYYEDKIEKLNIEIKNLRRKNIFIDESEK